MKKVYAAPKIYFESFTMSTNIAGDCEFDANMNRGQCAYTEPNQESLFFSALISACAVNREDGDGYCYYTPSDSTNIFNS